ncbi:unnamed protein product [Amoebophrya sp. A120]|nr:unnamed protein product [Amoebophrya sp. A120]|eukprot:GSA120T00014055001.1
MANLTGVVQTQTQPELPQTATRPMGTRRHPQNGRTVVQYKGDMLPMNYALPETVFRSGLFDLKKEVRSVKRGIDRRHGKNLDQAKDYASRKRVTRSLADPECYDPQPTAESVAAIESRLDELKRTSGDALNQKGSRVKIMNLPDDVVNRGAGANDFRLDVIQKDIDHKEEYLRSGRYKTRHLTKKQSVPIGITIDENQNDKILYDEYPQWYRMSEYGENFFARGVKTTREMGMGKQPYAIHEKVPDYDFRMSMIKHQIAMGERKG